MGAAVRCKPPMQCSQFADGLRGNSLSRADLSTMSQIMGLGRVNQMISGRGALISAMEVSIRKTGARKVVHVEYLPFKMGTLDDREMQRFIYDALAPHIPAVATTTIAGIRKPKHKKPSPPSISFPPVFEYVKLEQ